MRSESGFTLIELMVASLLSVLVLVIASGMIISSFSAEHNVQQSMNSSSYGQLAAQSVSSGVRGASRISLTAPSPNTQLLMALVVDDAVANPATAHCRAWYFGGGEIRTTTSATAIAPPLDHADVANWSQLARGVQGVGGAPVFTVLDPTVAIVDILFQLRGDTGITVHIETSAASRQPGAPLEVENLCF